MSGEPGQGVTEVGGDVGVLPDGIEVAEGVVEDGAGAVGGGPGEGEIGGGGGWEADGGGIERRRPVKVTAWPLRTRRGRTRIVDAAGTRTVVSLCDGSVVVVPA